MSDGTKMLTRLTFYDFAPGTHFFPRFSRLLESANDQLTLAPTPAPGISSSNSEHWKLEI